MNHSDPIASRQSLESSLQGLRNGDEKPLCDWLRGHLFEHVLPFWEKHAIDPQGGILTCIDDTGKVQSTEKWLWSQWRAVWVYSRLYNTLDRDPKWVAYAQQIAEFCLKHGWLEEEQGWALLLSQEGEVLRRHESIYTDGFAVYGLAELYRATGDMKYRDWAVRTTDGALEKLKKPYDTVPHFPYGIPPGTKPHGLPMIWSLTLADLGTILNEPRYLKEARRLSETIYRDHYKAADDRIIEFVNADGSDYAEPEGAVTVPGHAIEDMWFQWHVFEQTDWKDAPREETLRLILRHMDLGWDKQYGGILLAIDRHGRKDVGWGFPESKLWWPQTEALYATLLGGFATGDPAYFDWYEKLWKLCLDSYVDWENGEWRQKLQRDLTPFTEVIALPVKDPFHLPRALMLQIELLEARQRKQ